MRSFFEAMQQATIVAVHAWPLGKPMRMLEPMQQITLRVILQVVLGLGQGPQRDEIQTQVLHMLAQGRSRYSLILVKVLPVRRLQESRWLPYFGRMNALNDSLYTHIRMCRQQDPVARGENMLADLLAARHEDGRPMSDEEIRDALMTLILAGHDTTAIALAWALEQIVTRPDVVERITDELQRATGGGPVCAEHLPRLEYLDAAIRESMRLRTVLPFVVRLTKRAFVVGGHEYPPDVLLCPCSHLVHRRADLYPEPEVLRPERFLERRYAGHEWFPFGGGNRMCLGMTFALYEMKVVLGTLLHQVRLTRPSGSQSLPIRRGLSLAPHDGVKMVVLERLQRQVPATSTMVVG
jgi:unspecific monooxygenase